VIELRRALPFLVFSLLLLVAGCSLLPATTPSARELLAQELRAAEAHWASKDISTYRFTLTYSCFCPWTDPMAVVVVDDQVTSVTMNGEAVANAGGLPLLVESAFEQVRSSLDAHEIEAAFDPEFGFPSRVIADPIENAVDEEFSFRITDFVPGEVPHGAGGPAIVAEIAAHRLQWLAQGVWSYEWRVTFSCECVLSGPTTITVVNGEVTAVSNPLVAVRPDEVEVEGFPLTVDALYEEALRTLEAGGTAEATWDAASGLPRTLFLDRDRNTIDDELSVTIESLVPAS
jgi:hypothetical protein